jgi:hypothetical protein
MKITSREIKFFVLGLLTSLIIDFVWNWSENMQIGKEAFKEGYEDARK